MTNEEKLAHLNRLCCLDASRVDLAAPFRVDGQHAWSCATDGKWMFAWRGELVSADKMPVVKRDHAAKWLRAAVSADVVVSTAKLREYCGDVTFPRIGMCPDCNGAGIVQCEDEDEEECWDCEGEKTRLIDVPTRHGVLFGTPFNLARIACLLDGLEDEMVWIRVVPSTKLDDQQLQMHGADWIALLMPMRLHDFEIEAAPVFEATPKAA